MPNIYQQTYQTYESLGASDRDMQRGTTLVFYQQTQPTYGSMGASDRDMQRGTILDFG